MCSTSRRGGCWKVYCLWHLLFNKSLCSDTLTLHRPRAPAPRLPLLVLFQPLHAVVFYTLYISAVAPLSRGFG